MLDNGLTFTPIQTANDEAQLNETLGAINEQIAGAFRVPVSKIGDLSRANYSNMEVSEQAYVTSTLDPYYRSFELACQRDLLTSRQYSQFSVQFDRSALTRNDTKALHEALCQGIQNGIYSQNNARRKLGENPIPDGDAYLINSALQPVGAPKGVPACCLTWNGGLSWNSGPTGRRLSARGRVRQALGRPRRVRRGRQAARRPSALTPTANIVALYIHDAGAVLGRTPKTLTLATDTRGLAFQLNPAPTTAGRDALRSSSVAMSPGPASGFGR